jgi:TonB family protein
VAAGAFLAVVIAATTLPSATAPASQPQWLRQPSGEDIARFYPSRARERVLSGRAVVSCVIAPSGRLADCKAVEEVPAGYGFGDAAVQVAGEYVAGAQGSGRAREGITGTRVQVPVLFTVQGWVDLRCSLDAAGRAANCRAVSEHPPGRGLGAAYAREADGVVYDPQTFRRDGDALETTVRFPVPIDPAPDS